MALIRYPYTLLNRDNDQLEQEIAAAGLTGYIGICGGANGLIHILFDPGLSAPQEDVLDALVANHAPDPNQPLIRFRNRAKEKLDSIVDEISLAVRSVVIETVSELNILRRQIIGIRTAVWDPANIVNGAGLSSPGVNVPGAAFGDFVLVSAPYSLQGLTATAYVSAADTIVVRLENQTGGAINLGSGQWKVAVWRPEEMAPRTKQVVRTALLGNMTSGSADSLET